MLIRSELPWSFTGKTSPPTFQPRTVHTPIYKDTQVPHHFKSQQGHYSAIQPSDVKDTLFRSSSNYVYSTPFSKKDGKIFQDSTRDEGLIVSNGINFRKKHIPGTQSPPFKDSVQTPGEISSDVNYLKSQIIRLRKELQLALLQKQQFKQKVKAYEQQKQQAVNTRNKHLISLLEDYDNMKSIVQKLIEDNITLRSLNQKLNFQINSKTVKPSSSIADLRQQISRLKSQNSQLTTGNQYVEEYKELLRSKEQDIENLRVNEQNMEGKLKQLLDGLRFYHERFEEEKAEILDQHDNFKRSAISEIARLKREVLQKSRVPQLIYNFESDANYIKLITY